MNRFQYKGEDCNLGRFGPVRKGDVLILTDQEAEGITGDKRFSRLKDNQNPKPGQFVPVSDNLTPEQREAAEKANKAEKERLETLAKENDADRVEILEIKSKSFDELAAIAAKINAEAGGTIIDIGRRTSRPELMRQILQHRRNLKGGEPIEGELDDADDKQPEGGKEPEGQEK
jgi:hypothetical protein